MREAGVRAMVDLHNRWNPPFNTARAAVEAGEIGRATHQRALVTAQRFLEKTYEKL